MIIDRWCIELKKRETRSRRKLHHEFLMRKLIIITATAIHSFANEQSRSRFLFLFSNCEPHYATASNYRRVTHSIHRNLYSYRER